MKARSRMMRQAAGWGALWAVSAAGMLHAARICCWRLEEVDGTYAPNSGTAPSCGLYVARSGAGSSNVVYTAAATVTGDRWVLSATGSIAQLWAWTSSGVLDSSDNPPALAAAVTGDFSVLARVWWNDSDWNNIIMSKYSGWDQPGFYLSMRDDGAGGQYIVWYVDDSAGAGTLQEVLYGPVAGLSGRWVYVAGVRQVTAGTNVCRIYVDGVLVQVVTNGVTGSLGNNAPMRLGSVGAADANAFGGAMAEAAIWDEALTPATIAFYTNHAFYLPCAPATNVWPLKRLAVYYGYPSLVNNAGGFLQAAYNAFAPYDIIVFGEGLEEPEHSDHAFTDQLIDMLVNAGKEVYGYVDLGVSTRNHSYTTLTNKMSLWRAMGATGIFLDDYGYDYETPRVRQTNAVAYAHKIGCGVCANAWEPADALGALYNAQYNPNQLPTLLDARDAILAESFVIMTGGYDNATSWIEKSHELVHYTTQAQTRVWCLTTSTSTSDYSLAKWWYACDAAILYGFAASGWGEPNFSATGEQAHKLPWRPSRRVYIGTAIVTRADGAMPTNAMFTEEGRWYLDTAAHVSGFEDLVAPRMGSNVFVWPYAQCSVGMGQYEVQWRVEGIYDYGLPPQPVSLTLISGAGEFRLTNAIANSGSWTWNTANVAARDDYRIVLQAVDAAGHSAWQTSAVFSVVIPEPAGMLAALASLLCPWGRWR